MLYSITKVFGVSKIINQYLNFLFLGLKKIPFYFILILDARNYMYFLYRKQSM